MLPPLVANKITVVYLANNATRPDLLPQCCPIDHVNIIVWLLSYASVDFLSTDRSPLARFRQHIFPELGRSPRPPAVICCPPKTESWVVETYQVVCCALDCSLGATYLVLLTVQYFNVSFLALVPNHWLLFCTPGCIRTRECITWERLWFSYLPMPTSVPKSCELVLC